MSEYRDTWYQSSDGLRLYARDYAHAAPRGTVLCLHGLSRNSADFEDLAPLVRELGFRVIVADQRGRGLSDYDPQPARYHPGTYVQDMFTLQEHLGLREVIAIGTSMGGLMTMIMAALRPGVFRAAVLNDIGPVIEAAGLERIKGYVGRIAPPANWTEAAATARAINGQAFPEYADADWMRFARRTYREVDGRIVPACDPAISQPITASPETAVPPDLWGAFAALRDVPTLVIRGALSDILSAQCVREMKARKPDLRTVEVPGRGHAPALDEAEAVVAIEGLLAAV
jgi:pimeloyl-ACP methyl ester carboxylesterase